MANLQFPKPFRHDHPPVPNVNEIYAERSTFGQRVADLVAGVVGSWPFILIQSGMLLVWVALNFVAWIEHWDPYPFILLNLMLSLQAAYTAPVLMMSQNRLALRDRLMAQADFDINRKAEIEIRAILDHLEAQELALGEIYRLLSERGASPPGTGANKMTD